MVEKKNLLILAINISLRCMEDIAVKRYEGDARVHPHIKTATITLPYSVNS